MEIYPMQLSNVEACPIGISQGFSILQLVDRFEIMQQYTMASYYFILRRSIPSFALVLKS